MIWSGYAKIVHPHTFLTAVQNYGLLPGLAVVAVAVAVPWLEFTTGGLLLLRAEPRVGFALTTAIALIFAVAQGTVLYRGMSADCGCSFLGVVRDQPISWFTLGRALILAAAGCVGWAVTGTHRQEGRAASAGAASERS